MKLVKPALARPEVHRRGFALVAILVVAALVIGIGATLGYQKLTTKPLPSPSPTDQPVNLSESSPSPTEETTNWKTYTSSRYGFSFRYPETGIVEESNATILGTTGKDEVIINLKIDGGSLRITGNEGGRGVAANRSYEIAIAGRSTVKIYEGDSSILIKSIMSPKNDEIYFSIILPSDTTKASELDKTFDQILSTFKFLD